MTVKELMSLLATHDPEAIVLLPDVTKLHPCVVVCPLLVTLDRGGGYVPTRLVDGQDCDLAVVPRKLACTLVAMVRF